MNDGKERREQPTEIARSGQELVSIDRVENDSERHTAVRGSVYLIVNDLIRGRVKIGYTTRDPIERAAELVTTGTTGTFVVIYEAMVRNPYAVEQAVHRRLKKHNCGLEWFEVCPNQAKEEIWGVAGEVLYENTMPRWHRSQPEPSNETKELLREARQAADEKRRREEEEVRRARLAAEETRIKQAKEAAEAQRLADEEEYRRRAEQQAREAAIREARKKQAEEAAEAQGMADEANRLRKVHEQARIAALADQRRRKNEERASRLAEIRRTTVIGIHRLWRYAIWVILPMIGIGLIILALNVAEERRNNLRDDVAALKVAIDQQANVVEDARHALVELPARLASVRIVIGNHRMERSRIEKLGATRDQRLKDWAIKAKSLNKELVDLEEKQRAALAGVQGGPERIRDLQEELETKVEALEKLERSFEAMRVLSD